MIKDLVKVATKLDSLGLKREADYIDSLIRKIAGEGSGDPAYDYAMTLKSDDEDPDYRDHMRKIKIVMERTGLSELEAEDLVDRVEMEEGFDISDEDLDLRSQMLEERSEMYSGEPSSLMGEHRPYHHELFPHSRKGRS